MENSLKALCSFIHNLTTLENTIASNKLSYPQVDKLFSLVDVKGRGYLDLGDVYDLVGNVSEDELFTIFKNLDKNRSGQIRASELKKVFGNEDSKSQELYKEYIFPKFYKVVDALRQKPKTIADAKNKLNLSSEQLKQVYAYLCQLVQSKYLTVREFATVMKAQSMKYGLIWGDQHEKVLEELMAGQSMTQAKFTDCFGRDNKIKIEVEEENLLSGIQDYTSSSIYSANKRSQYNPRPSQHMEKVSPITLSKSHHQESQNASIIYTKTSNFVEPLDTPSFRNNMPQQRPRSPQYRGKKEFDQIEGNIHEVLGAIQQRREKLRQDSLERKKIIDDVMNRKRQLCGKGYSSPKNEANWDWKEPQLSYNGTSTLKLQSKSYLKQSSYLSSSPKQPGYPDLQVYAQRQKRDSIKAAHSPYASPINQPDIYTPVSPYKAYAARGQEYSYGAGYDLAKRRPGTPTAGQVGLDISDILKKYNNKEEDSNTLKQMCKSMSGFLYTQPSLGSSYQRCNAKYPSQMNENYEGRWQAEESAFNPRVRASSKENVMKRAEEEAARKIEQIQRKARMKVLEKKNILGRNDNRDWRGLAKKGAYY